MKKILVLHTGGTISMQADNSGRVVPNQDNPMTKIHAAAQDIQLTVSDFLNLPSPHITP
ncbi:TPA: asparaginase domain-containing protein, partial [Streptococcus pyogenes]